MTILICNDDGVNAPGLHQLIKAVAHLGTVVAVAPDAPRSGQSGAITVNAPLTITEHPEYTDAQVYSVSGTPVDCVKLALHTILPTKPDLMLCGINHGTNSGNCVLYSGTMGAVLEAATNGIPAIGFSLTHHSLKADFSASLPWVELITRTVIGSSLPEGTCLNVNIPARCEPRGIKVVRAARGHWTEEYQQYTSPSGRPFYWLTGRFDNIEPEADDTDEYWLDRQYISVVPVGVDQTDRQAIGPVSQIFERAKH